VLKQRHQCNYALPHRSIQVLVHKKSRSARQSYLTVFHRKRNGKTFDFSPVG
jgi:hypothetical protein